MSLQVRYQRRGVVAVQVAVLSIVLLGFTALAVDVGRLYAVKAEAQRTADAAALAGVSGLASDGMLRQSDASISAIVESRATDIARRNQVFNSESHLACQDIEFGSIADPFDYHCPFVPGSPSMANAIRVTIRRSAGSTDGPIPTAFAGVLGKPFVSVVATATAILNDRFAGFRPPADGGGVLIPFTIERGRYDEELASGADNFSYEDGSVKSVADGIREIWLYPDKQGGDSGGGNGKGNGKQKAAGGSSSGDNSNGGSGSGNFGILNVGSGNNGVPGIEAQILHGVTPEDLVAEIGAPEIRFIDDAGHAVTHQISGNPGIKAGIKDALEARIGDVVGFFIHTVVGGNGANAEFTIVDVRFGRVMEVDLTGSANGGKRLVIQPTAYQGSGAITDPRASSAGPYVSRIQLAR